MSFRVARAFCSGGCINVGPNTIPRFSEFMKLSFSNVVTLWERWLLYESERWETTHVYVRLHHWFNPMKIRCSVCFITSWDASSGSVGSRSGLVGAAAAPRGWPPVWCLGWEFLPGGSTTVSYIHLINNRATDLNIFLSSPS
jgi:hypothetical protein